MVRLTTIFLAMALLLAPRLGSSRRADPTSPLPARGPLQGLTENEQRELYHLAQGGEALPVSWLHALEDLKTGRPFLATIERFGALRDPYSPNGLPVGFSRDVTRDLSLTDVKMTALNCASCHTGEVRYRGKAVRILGGQSFFDPNAYRDSLAEAVSATFRKPLKLIRFLYRLTTLERRKPSELLEAVHSSAEKDPAIGTLIARLPAAIKKGWKHLLKNVKTFVRGTAKLVKKLSRMPLTKMLDAVRKLVRAARITFAQLKTRFEKLSAPSATAAGMKPGFGRVDAFGTAFALFSKEAPVPYAPVSYQHLWDVGQTKWYHYDANTDSAIERNVGNSLGLGVVYDAKSWASTLKARNLYRLEELVRKIEPPKWPAEVLGAIDAAKVKRGSAIFAKRCASCHVQMVGEVLPLSAIGTDPARARTTMLRITGPSGKKVLALEYAAEVGRKALRHAFKAEGISTEEQKAFARGQPDRATWRAPAGYRVPSLRGIWATAPYLHNGSVPSLYDLLLPPPKRPRNFYVGSYNFDPVKVGFVTLPGDVAVFELDTALDGNRNIGHTAGTDLSDRERWALVEYLKTL